MFFSSPYFTARFFSASYWGKPGAIIVTSGYLALESGGKYLVLQVA